ncbi:MAG: hypothetical protein WBN15_02820 [Polyangiales bacterium]
MKQGPRWLAASACLTAALFVEARAAAQDVDVIPDGQPAEVELVLDEPADLAPAMASPEDLSHLDLWIEYMGKSSRRGRMTGGATLLAVGSIVTAIGIAFYVATPVTELDKGLGLAFLGVGGAYVAIGTAQLAKKSAGEELLASWRSARDGGLNLRELGRFEGELRNHSRLVRRAVKVSRWTMFGIGMTGALILGLTPAADLSSDAARFGYGVGGILAGAGFLSFSFTFIKSAKVDYWAAYQKGQRPPRSRWSAAPSFSRSYAGINVVGQF